MWAGSLVVGRERAVNPSGFGPPVAQLHPFPPVLKCPLRLTVDRLAYTQRALVQLHQRVPWGNRITALCTPPKRCDGSSNLSSPAI